MRHTMEPTRWRRSTPNPSARQLRRRFPRSPTLPPRGDHRPGGPTYREAQLCMEMIADTGRCLARRRWSSIPCSTSQPHRRDRRRPDRLALRKEHPDALAKAGSTGNGNPLNWSRPSPRRRRAGAAGTCESCRATSSWRSAVPRRCARRCRRCGRARRRSDRARSLDGLDQRGGPASDAVAARAASPKPSLRARRARSGRPRCAARARCRARRAPSARRSCALLSSARRARSGCAACSVKCSNSSGMSSRRSRSGGSSMHDDVEPVVEVGAEAALRRSAPARSSLVAAMTRQSTGIALVRAEALDAALLQHAQQLDLQRHRHALDLVEEQRAAVGVLELADAPLAARR